MGINIENNVTLTATVGILFDVKGTYTVGEWIVGAGLGYKF